MEEPTPLSPRWWLRRLHAALAEQQEANRIYREYYLGIHPTPWLAAEAREEFHRLLALTRSNYLGLVADAQVERQEVVGFRVSSGTEITDAENDVKIDDVMWRIWRENDMEAHFDGALLEAAVTGRSYVMLAPPGRGSKIPRLHVEHPDQMVMEFVPGTNRRIPAAALKVWEDHWTGRTHATLFYRDHREGSGNRVWVWKFASRATGPSSLSMGLASAAHADWEPRQAPGESWPARLDLERIPVWELPNNPLLLTGGRSELDDLMVIQDRINKGLADRLIAQDFGAFPQKWASGWPDVDAAGQPQAKPRIGQDRLLVTDAVETKFGSFDATDLGGYIETKMTDVKDIASRSRTPAQYLLGEVANVAGDTLRMAESGLTAKVRERNIPHGSQLSSMARMARRMYGEAALPEGSIIDTLWRNPEYRSEGEMVDALVKMRTLGVPEEALWERWGASPQEISRWKAMREKELSDQLAADPLTALAGRYPERGQQGQQGQQGDALERAARTPSPASGSRLGARTSNRS